MNERLITLSEAAELLPENPKLSALRCATTGHRGVLLEVVLVDGGLRTTGEAVGRFKERIEQQ